MNVPTNQQSRDGISQLKEVLQSAGRFRNHLIDEPDFEYVERVENGYFIMEYKMNGETTFKMQCTNQPLLSETHRQDFLNRIIRSAILSVVKHESIGERK